MAIGSQLRSTLLSLVLLAALASPGMAETGDPFERSNRAVHRFNMGLDRVLIEPVSRAWNFIVPEVVQTGIDNIFNNLGMPIVFVNDVLQAKPLAAAEDVGRFVLNSTLGLAGIFDLATMLELPENDEDFGQTLGAWGVPPGPYWVLPLFGPSNPRDTAGLAVDSAAYPWGWVVPFYVTLPARTVDLVNLRAIFLEEIAANRETAFDYYVFLREAYRDNRRNKVADDTGQVESGDDELYYFDDDEV